MVLFKILSLSSSTLCLKLNQAFLNKQTLASLLFPKSHTLLYRDQSSAAFKQVDNYDKSKRKLIKSMNFKAEEDSLPFYNLPVKTLVHIYKVTENDLKNNFCENRLYYISEKIQYPPSIVSATLARRTFIYSLSFDWLESSLNVVLEMGIPVERLLRDLWVLKYHPTTIRDRLQRVKDMGIDNLYPWMVRCSENILNRSIEIKQQEKNILGDNMSTQVYLAKRLQTSPQAVEEMCYRLPALKTIRVTKVKMFLDFLIKEGFDVSEIANKPRVLTASQDTVEKRLATLRSLGLSEINLNVLCRSKKDFRKFCDTFHLLEIHKGT